MIVTTIDLRTSVSSSGFPVPIPASRAFLYGPFQDVDEQETRPVSFRAFWGLNGEERALSNPDDAIFIASLMENDDGNAEALRGFVAAAANSALFASLDVTDRATRVTRVMEAINSAMNIPTGFPSTDEKIGGPKEIFFTPQDIAQAETGQAADRKFGFEGDGGAYTLTFRAINRGQAGWRFCFRCHSLYFDGFSPQKGACPAGGGHAAAGFVFYLPHDHAGPLGGQADWRFCHKCFAMFWAFDPSNQGLCPAGGRHEAAGFVFFLPHDHNGPGQPEWRFCDKCRVMFWNGEANKGVCRAGGGHNAQGFNFKLDFT